MSVLDRIRREDLPDAPEGEWLDVILYSVNRFMENVYKILSNNITLSDNFNGGTIITKITQNDIDNGLKLKNPIFGTPRHVIISQIYKDTGSFTNYTTAPYPSWIFEEGFIKIKNITGMDSTSKYNVTFLVLGD
jgi:hypothetical protein